MIKVLNYEEISDSVKHSIDLEYKGKQYTCQVITDGDYSDTLFFNSKGDEIDIPNWTDDLDFWELVEQAEQERE